ncbi:MAG TPA: tRNA (guanosine(46)-N7)-methyltransferase TrmB [Bacteroidia bacterium]|jgi:tRNA (guanine-N7-)-methyltransferase|nr:tRNA (guanosine(46)-N7)-methyltransferase TrmB [Bacteroidia bacterium]
MPNKLQKFAEVETFSNCSFFPFEKLKEGHPLAGKWRKDYFKNENPLLLELGCGKGEYTIGLAKNNPNKNYIGVDIKGNRIWTGAKYATEVRMKNVAFIRTRIDFIEPCFAEGEVNEIWLTFPDPQPQKTRARKRLTHPMFLNRYKKFLKPGGMIHLKTDSTSLYEYTLELIKELSLPLLYSTSDLYLNNPSGKGELTQIKTHYEKLFTEKGEKIKYCCFKLS